jgi:hypothetical protein
LPKRIIDPSEAAAVIAYNAVEVFLKEEEI